MELLASILKSLQINVQIVNEDTGEVKELVNTPHSDIVLSTSIQKNNENYTATIEFIEEVAVNLVEQTNTYKNLALDLQTILNSSREAIFLSDAEGNTLHVSESWKKLWHEEGLSFFEKGVFQIEQEGVISPSATRIVSEKKERVQIIQKTDSGRTLMVVGMPIFNEDGDIQRIISVSEDITEISTLKEENKRLQKLLEDDMFSSLVFNSEKMHGVLRTALKAASTDSTVLITGETGVGKESIVDYIHKSSKRYTKPLIKVNCGSIPDDLLESELFGYAGGTFTGALPEGKQGLFEAAHEGTIFLDEIGDIALPLQVKLLRVLQEQEVTRLGETKPRKLNVRIIAATNKNLPLEIQENRFREDLYYRLNVVPITVPPLRKRLDDILPLIILFTEKFNRKFKKTKVISTDSIESFYAYHWPGNIRELRNVIERLIVLTETDYIEPNHLPRFLQNKPQKVITELSNPKLSESKDKFEVFKQLSRTYRKLNITHGEWGLICTIFSYEEEDWIFYVNESLLAEHLNCGIRQINKWLFSLREKGFLTVHKNNRGKALDFRQLIAKSQELTS